MQKIDKRPEQKTDPLKILESIGLSLADGVKKSPYLSALVLIVLIAAVVSIIKQGALNIFLVIVITALIGMVLIFLIGNREQKGIINKYARAEVALGNNTIDLVNKFGNKERQDILRILRGASEDIAEILNIPLNNIRANLFGKDEQNRMRMLAGLTFQMDRTEELSISMPVGYGSTGRCFQSGKPNIAIFRGGWGKDVIEDEELRKVDPDIQWIISIPVLSGDEKIRPIWVINIDCLNERRERNELQEGLKRLFVWSQMLTLIIGKTLETKES